MEKNIYSRSKVSVKTLDVAITVGLTLLALLMIYFSANGGYEVRFDTDGGSEVASRRLRYGEQIEVPETPTKSDCVFVGWYVDEEFSEEFDFENSSVSGDTVIFASWREIE